jgi:hypothetical protein
MPLGGIATAVDGPKPRWRVGCLHHSAPRHPRVKPTASTGRIPALSKGGRVFAYGRYRVTAGVWRCWLREWNHWARPY